MKYKSSPLRERENLILFKLVINMYVEMVQSILELYYSRGNLN